MVFDITQLRKIRKQLDMTQHAFANEIGISQSMVAKIESGKLDPTYSSVKKIEERVMHLTKKEDGEAKDIMCQKIFSVKKDENAKDAINLIVEKDISQVLVVERGNVIGLVTEAMLLSGDLDKIKEKKIFEVMGEAPPIINKNARMEVILQLLKFYPILLVKDAGKLVGVITRTDIIRNLK